MHIAKSILKNFVTLFTAEFVTRLLHLLTVVYIARVLGVSLFGQINFVLAILSYFLISTNLGLNELGVREIARDKKHVPLFATSITFMRMVLACFSLLLISVLIIFMDKSPQTKTLLFIYGLTLFPYAFSLEWIFRGIERMEFIAVSKIAGALLYVSLIFLIVKNSAHLLRIGYITLGADLLSAIILLYIYYNFFSIKIEKIDLRYCASLLKMSLPICISSGLLVIYFNIATVILGLMKGDTAAGIYSAAYRLIMVFYTIISLFISALFPVISRYYKQSLASLEKIMSYSAKFILIVAVPVTILGVMLAGSIINIVYGKAYTDSVPVFSLLMWFMLVNSVSFILSYSLVGCDRQNTYLWILFFAAAVNLFLNFLLIPAWGSLGAAASLVVTEMVILISSVIVLNTFIKLPIMKFILKPVLASFAMLIFLYFFRQGNLFIAIVSSVVIYLAVLFVIKGTSKKEIDYFRGALFGR